MPGFQRLSHQEATRNFFTNFKKLPNMLSHRLMGKFLLIVFSAQGTSMFRRKTAFLF
jgi:hypothetical protein